MKLVAVVGSYRKGKTIDTLVDCAIEGVCARRERRGEDGASNDGIEVDKIHLVDKDIAYCTNCMVCRRDDPAKPMAKCSIKDDMQAITAALDAADAFIFGTPVNLGHETAVMKTFLERACWVLARPGHRPVNGCPKPRTTRRKKAIIIVSSGIIRPLFRRWCDDATPLLKGFCRDQLNAKVLGSLYAGAVEKRGIDRYRTKAFRLGQRLAT